MEKRDKLFASLAIIGLLVLGAIVRFSIAQEPLWLDELHTAWCVTDGLGEVAGRAADGNQGPLFFWLTWPIVAMFGESTLAVRSVSLASGLVLLLLAMRFVWSYSRSVVGLLLAGLLVSLDWRFVFYATEARPYALLQVLGFAQAWLFIDLTRLPNDDVQDRSSKNWKWIGITLLSVLLFYCHYACVWLFVAEAIAVVCLASWRVARPASLAGFAIAVACLPGLLNLVMVLGRRSNWSSVSSPATLWGDVQVPVVIWVLVPIGLWLAWGSVARLAGLSLAAQPKRNDSVRLPSARLLTFVLLWALVPVVGALAMHWLGVAPMALFRYTTIGTVAFSVFAGLLVSKFDRCSLRMLVLLLVVMVTIWHNPIARQLATFGTVPFMRYEDWGPSIAMINDNAAKRSQPVFVFANVLEDVAAQSDFSERFQNYLLFPVSGFQAVERDGRGVQACPTGGSIHFLAEQLASMKEQDGAWLLIRGRRPTIDSILEQAKAGIERQIEAGGASRGVSCRIEQTDGFSIYLLSIDLE